MASQQILSRSFVRTSGSALVHMLVPAIVLLSISHGYAQSFPLKPVRLVTGGAASNSDFAARVVGQGLTGIFKQQVIVENRPSGVILGEIVARASPDGHTLLISGSSFWLAPFLQNKLSWDPVRDFVPVVLVSSAPNIIVVNPALSIKSVHDLIAYAKLRPGELNYASGSTGSTPHLAAELFKAMAGVDITRINYKGSGQAVTDVIGGQIPLMFAAAGSVINHIKAGRLRALAVTSLRPSPLAPGLPAVAEAGVAGYECLSLTGLFAPAKTSAALIQRLNRDTNTVLAAADIKERLLGSGVEAVGGSPEQFAAVVQGEIKRLGRLIRDTGIQND